MVYDLTAHFQTVFENNLKRDIDLEALLIVKLNLGSNYQLFH